MTASALQLSRALPLVGSRPVLAAALASLLACGFNEVDGNGRRAKETRDAANFSRVESHGSLEVRITQADEPSLVVSIDENLQAWVTTRVADGWLHIETRKEIGEVLPGPHVWVTLPELHAAKLSGSGSLRAELEQPEQAVDLNLDGSGDMSFRGHAAAIGAYLSGSGDIELEGETSDLEVELSGSGSVRGRALSAESGNIELRGSGEVSATVRSSVRVSLSGSGQIDLYGDANIESYSDSGSGDIVAH